MTDDTSDDDLRALFAPMTAEALRVAWYAYVGDCRGASDERLAFCEWRIAIIEAELTRRRASLSWLRRVTTQRRHEHD